MKIREGFVNDKTPDMKYYAFDWDDNIVHMPTTIILLDENGNEVGMGTSDFADFRSKIGVEPFEYNGSKIVSYADNPFRNFRDTGDRQFLIDAMKATPGPVFNDFVEAINNGSIFAIITARGHNPNTIKEAVYNYIVSGFNGIDKNQLVRNLRKYRDFVDEEDMTDEELIRNYLDLTKYYPISYGSEGGSASSPEEKKIMSMDDFIAYVKSMAAILNKKAYLKNDVSNNFVPTSYKLGFSDDDIKNVDKMKKHLDNKPEQINTYLSARGAKTKL